MAISPVSGTAASQELERSVAVMKRSKDVEKETAASLIELVKDASKGQKIDTYA